MPDAITFNMTAAAARFEARMRQFVSRTTTDGHEAVRQAALQIMGATRAMTPVDTGALRAAWSQPRPVAPLSWAFGNTQPYAHVVEYGLYPGVGRRTVQTGGAQFGEFLIAGGIFSSQAPYGMLRRNLALARPGLYQRLITTHQRAWGH